MRNFKIKICGITIAKDALRAFQFGADAIGLNFYEKSKRYVSPIDAMEIAQVVPKSLALVGVFVNETPQDILEFNEHLSLAAVQLHGDESVEIMAELNSANVIRAIRVSGSDPESVLLAQGEIDVWQAAGAKGILLDKAAGDQYGGSGETFDWNLLHQLRFQVPVILAGGLNPTNVGEAILTGKPDAVDVASGVEASAGVKDSELMQQFISESQQAFKSWAN